MPPSWPQPLFRRDRTDSRQRLCQNTLLAAVHGKENMRLLASLQATIEREGNSKGEVINNVNDKAAAEKIKPSDVLTKATP